MADIAAILRANPTYGAKSKSALYEVLRRKHGVSKKAFDEFLENDEAAQRLPFLLEQVPNRAVVKRRAVSKKISLPSYSFQIDVAFAGWKSANRDRFLILVEANSRRVFVRVLPSNKATDVTAAYKILLDDEIIPSIPLYAHEPDSDAKRRQFVYMVHGDKFFDNKTFHALNTEYGIRTSTSVAADDHKSRTGNKLGLVDAAIKTIKRMLWRYHEANDDPKWPTFIHRVVDEYNDTPHSALGGSTPEEMWGDRAALAAMYRETQEHNEASDQQAESQRLPVGTRVRLIRERRALQKGGARLSNEVYEIVRHATSTTYVLKDVRTDKEMKRRPRLEDVVRVSPKAVPLGARGARTLATSGQERALRREGISAPTTGRKRTLPKKANVKEANRALDMFD